MRRPINAAVMKPDPESSRSTLVRVTVAGVVSVVVVVVSMS
jgi:hypothetical protein